MERNEMQWLFSISHPNPSATDGEELWIERLQQRPASPPIQPAGAEPTEAQPDAGPWIERLQQRRFAAAR
jgi:hypothetical protein